MAIQDKTLTCSDCGGTFVFTKDEQEFYQQKGFRNEPKRCPQCRKAKKFARGGGGGGGGGGRGYGRGGGGGYGGGERQSFNITCSACGRAATVPFKPRNNKPVYCDACFKSQRSGGAVGGGSTGGAPTEGEPTGNE